MLFRSRPGRGPAEWLRGDRDPAPVHRRAAGPAHRDDLPCAAPLGGCGADHRVVVGGGRPPATCLPADAGRSGGAVGQAVRLAGPLLPPPRPPIGSAHAPLRPARDVPPAPARAITPPSPA